MTDKTNLVPTRSDQTSGGYDHVLDDGEYLARTQPLLPGHYWRAKAAIKHKGADEPYIPGGCVLLLQRLKRVDDKPHAVELAGHPLLDPGSTHTFLVHDFLNRFEPEPNGAVIREDEMRKVQADINEKQRDLLDFSTSPTALLEELRKNPALPKPETRNQEKAGLPVAPFDFAVGLPGAEFRPSTALADLASGLDQEGQSIMRRRAENQAIIAKKRADIIGEKTKAIASAVKQLTPFYEEQSLVAIAQCEDALDIYGKLKSGLASLGLYTGKDVVVTPVRVGESAPVEEPIHILQALMHMDEESLINLETGGANCGNLEDFAEQLRTDDVLLKRIVPFPRGIVAMRYKHETRDHAKGTDAFVAARIDAEDMKCFLIVRNGERVNIVQSSLEKLDRLFPTQSDLDRPFTQSGFWHGIESERITVEDLDFSEARSKFDKIVLHYRRLVILIAGLYDRERGIIGDIPALGAGSGLALLKMPIQEAAFRPVSDEEFALGSGHPGFWDWLAEKNRATQSGSRLICNWRTLMTAETAPGAVTRGDRYDHVRYDAKDDFSLAISYKDGDIAVDCPVDAGGRRDDFNARVSITKYGEPTSLGYLCLDDVSPEEIDYYIYTRHERHGYIKYVRLLLAARKVVAEDRAHEAPLRRDLIDALQQGGMLIHGAEDSPLVSTVIRQWRAARRGAAVLTRDDPTYPSMRGAMLHQLWVLAGQGRDRRKVAEEIAAAEGRTPLRLALSGRTRLYLYATATAEEREDLLGPHPWVVRLTLEELKTKVSVVERRQVLLPKTDAKETVLAEWAEDIKNWIEPDVGHQLPYEEVRDLRNLGAVAAARALRWLAPCDDDRFDTDLAAVRSDTRERSTRMVTHGALFMPLVLIRRSKAEQYWPDGYGTGKRKETRFEHTYYVGGVEIGADDALYLKGTPEQRKKVIGWFKAQYNDSTHAIATLKKGRAARFIYLGIDGLKEAVKTDFHGFEGRGEQTKTFDADVVKLVKAIKERGRYASDVYTCDVLMRFDADAAVVYKLLAKEPIP